MLRKIKNFSFTEKTAPLLLFLAALASYIPLVTMVGFYWDDWPMLYFKVTRGAAGFANAFDSDRPFLSYLYQITSHLPDNPLIWQILTVLLRSWIAVLFWHVLTMLWKGRKREPLWAGILLAVYPGFKQMPIAYVWMNGMILLLFYVLSWEFMLLSLHSGGGKKAALAVMAVLSFTLCTISTEYYVGLEASRGLILYFYFLNNDENFCELNRKEKIKKIISVWAPYIAVLAVFLVWRVFVFGFHGYQPVLVEQASGNPLRAVFDVFVRAAEDAHTAFWGAWTEFLKFPNHTDFETASGKIFWISTVLSFAAIWFVMHCYEKDEELPDRRWRLSAVGLGLFMIIIPGFPYWITSLPIKLSYPYDRFLIAFMFGSCILMCGLIRSSVRYEWMQTAAAALFAAAAVGGNILNANSYRKDWNMQKDFVQQMKARIPDLKPSTILLSDANPLAYESDNSMTGMINLALKPDEEIPEDSIPYSVMLFTSRFGSEEEYWSTDKKYQDFRGLLFEAENENVVVYHYSPPSCLRIIDPEQHAGLNIFPQSYKNFLYLSDPKGRINTNGTYSSYLPENYFGEYSTENWCYWFQKADLARQDEDWAAIAEIGDRKLPVMTAADPTEYFVFAEAYIRMDRWEDAGELFGRIRHESEGALDSTLCPYIHKWIGEHPVPGDKLDSFITSMNAVGCAYD
ncbi:MAG: hypothetical protein IJI14_07935 [Anaerolineaceae bacterium]|nr:hypothetical protein [Anaerolineaceae bacterium]